MVHSLTVLSALPLASISPSGEKTTENTAPLCPLNVRLNFPVRASHNFTSRSQAPLANVLLSGEKATEVTSWRCPVSVRTNSQVRTFQSRIVFSSGRLLPFAKTAPSGEKATAFTASTLRHFKVFLQFPGLYLPQSDNGVFKFTATRQRTVVGRES